MKKIQKLCDSWRFSGSQQVRYCATMLQRVLNSELTEEMKSTSPGQKWKSETDLREDLRCVVAKWRERGGTCELSECARVVNNILFHEEWYGEEMKKWKCSTSECSPAGPGKSLMEPNEDKPQPIIDKQVLKTLVGRTLLVTDSKVGIHRREFTLVEISPSGKFGQFRDEISNPKKLFWSDLSDYEVLDVLP